MVFPTTKHRLMRSPSRPRRRRQPPLACLCSTCRLATPRLPLRTHAGLVRGRLRSRCRSWGQPRTWPVAAYRSGGLRDIDLEHAAKELGVVHVVDAVGRVSAFIKLDKSKASVLLCAPREPRVGTQARAARLKARARTRRVVQHQVNVGDLAKGQEGRMQNFLRHTLLEPTWWGGWVSRRLRGAWCTGAHAPT